MSLIPSPSNQGVLARQLGLMPVIAISLGAMMGSGLFVLPGLAAGITGPSVWLAYLVAGVCVLPAALSKAELATAMPSSGGTYVYIDRTFGPLAGTVAGLGLWLSLLLKSAFSLVGFSAYLTLLVQLPAQPMALLLLAAVTAVNVLGVRNVGRVQIWVVGIALVGLSILAAWSFITFEPHLLQDEFPKGTSGFLGAVAFVYISYAGVTKVAAIAEEVHNPTRTLPLGILLSLVIVTTLYTTVTLGLAGNVPLDDLQRDLHPIYTLAEAVGGPVLGTCAALLGVLTMTSMANSGLLASSRFPFAMSRDDLLPKGVSWVLPLLMTPVVSIVLTAGVMGTAIVYLDIARIAKLAGAFMIAAFITENITVVILRESDAQWYKPSFRTPLYPLTQLFGALSGALLLLMLGPVSVIALLAISVPGAMLWFVWGRHRTQRRGVYGRLGPRQELFADEPLVTHDLNEALPGEASAVVALLGEERSPEALVEMGVALSGGSTTEVIHLTDVPEQIALADVPTNDVRIRSMRRRVRALAEERAADVEFDAVVTHDVVKTVHEVTSRVHCRWLVMESRANVGKGISLFNPLGWLTNHLSCNLALLRDAGIRYVRKVLVMPLPGPHDALVVDTADHLARKFGGRLTFVRFVPDDAPQRDVEAAEDYLAQLSRLCAVEPRRLVVRGDDEVQAIANLTFAYDLLIKPAAAHARFWDLIRGTASDRITRRAACSVLRLKAPPRQLHAVLQRRRASPSDLPIDLRHYVQPDFVQARLDCGNKEELFVHMAHTFAGGLTGVTAREVEEALWLREEDQNTGIGHGMALPHATVPTVHRTHLGVFTTQRPLHYDAPDGQPVDVFFMMLGPEGDRDLHLRVLSELSRRVLKTPMLEMLRSASSGEEIIEALGIEETRGTG